MFGLSFHFASLFFASLVSACFFKCVLPSAPIVLPHLFIVKFILVNFTFFVLHNVIIVVEEVD